MPRAFGSSPLRGPQGEEPNPLAEAQAKNKDNNPAGSPLFNVCLYTHSTR